ncbi:type II toxin-antitoxin system death-on-curing family toxin [Agrobacterium rosae]|uniref:Type II toxin-antitoxin system death-on-curing family toxin n=1 Tax=Agrobacterium rosae TaxID=1972867 RepID=A0AAE5VPB0_9HYPH|nr:type II toxin-antitoxin system death-on-curing family toxin [Agrobacterium rosae]KAA3522934.1 type II toxin-antitoxin system death-on-curing family toxin [Agrobacterium rosae]MQB47632.1 type II toxin-antitoxin system death-on-curing family toxin [Agrobacterium rosae]POO51322.1 type II toxin-antitoxin system death-on-curing family toxin [Agrobacterium rosae]
MLSEPNWLPAEAIIKFNRQQVALTDENHALLFPEKLDGAIVRPQNSFYYDGNSDAVSLSVNLMLSVASAHAFEQGNKRTGFVSGYAFLLSNGYDIHADLLDSAYLGQAFTDLIKRVRSASEFEAILKANVFAV